MKKNSVTLILWNNILEVISFKELYLLSVLFVMDFAFRIFFFPYRPPFWNCVVDNRCELISRLWFPIPGSTFFFHFPFPVLRSPLPVHRFPSHFSNFLRYPGYCMRKPNSLKDEYLNFTIGLLRHLSSFLSACGTSSKRSSFVWQEQQTFCISYLYRRSFVSDMLQ